MNGRIAILAALPQELKPLVTHKTARRWRKTASDGALEMWEYPHRHGCWIAACAGMGEMAVARAFSAAERSGALDCVATVGFAGAIDPGLRAGGVFTASQVVDTQTGERYRPGRWTDDLPVLASLSRIADADEKRRLREAYNAGLVDMEAAAVARLSESRHIPFYCLKAVSDEAGEALLPELGKFMGDDGQLRMGRFIAHSALRPQLWPGLIELGRNSKKAAENLAESIYEWVDERAYIRREESD